MSKKITAAEVAEFNKTLTVDWPNDVTKKFINALNKLGLTKQYFNDIDVIKVESWDDIEKNFWKHIRDSFK